MSDCVIQFEEVERQFAGVSALKKVAWEVEPNQHWVVLGPNGSGKST